MASAINYNTVWTSIFEPVSTFEFLKRYGASSPLAAKHDQPYHVVGSDLAGVVLRVGPGVTKWQPGDEVVAHCLSVELEDPQGHDDTMMDPQQRIWGFETNFGGLAELALVKSNQLMPKPAHLTWEEAAAPGPGQLHRLPAAGQPPRRRDEAGRHRADLGRVRRPRRLRHAVRAQRRRDPDLRRLVPREGRDLPVDGRRADHRPVRRGLPVLEGRRAAAVRVEAVRQEDPRAHRRRGPRHRLRASGTGDLRRQRLRHQARRHDRHLRLDLGLHARVRQPLPLDDAQAHRRLALRELPRVVGGQPAHRQGRDPPDAVAGLPAGGHRTGRLRRAPQPAPGQGRRAVPGARGGPRRPRHSSCAPNIWTRSTASAGSDPTAC